MPALPPPPNPPGPFTHVKALLAASLRYFRARLLLAKGEAKDAGLNYGIATGMVGAAVVLALVGYVFLIVCAVFAAARALGDGYSWIGVMGVAALLHFAAAIGLVLLAHKRIKSGVFPLTIEELKKDQTWLTSPTPKI